MNYTEVYFEFREMFLKVYLSLLKIEDKTRIELLKNEFLICLYWIEMDN
ncbi:hypothetical protein LEP1GSC041_1420 [Leptospira noguchii str. 2006001870]|nr:hypothetical protein LEP1GSC041_1420 [Leptospira noguchii str. 2006001870]